MRCRPGGGRDKMARKWIDGNEADENAKQENDDKSKEEASYDQQVAP